MHAVKLPRASFVAMIYTGMTKLIRHYTAGLGNLAYLFSISLLPDFAPAGFFDFSLFSLQLCSVSSSETSFAVSLRPVLWAASFRAFAAFFLEVCRGRIRPV